MLYPSKVKSTWRILPSRSCWPVNQLNSWGFTYHPPDPIALDLSSCLGGGLTVLMVGDLNAKHVDWNSRLITIRGRLWQ